METSILTEDKLASKTDPFRQFESWLNDEKQSDPLFAQDACLATGAKDGTISNRVITMDSFNHDGFVFYTSTEGQKTKDLECNPHCAMTFYWPALRRQVRIEGTACLLSNERSEEHFRKLPFDNQIVLTIAHQGQVLEEQGREELVRACEKMSADFKRSGKPVPKPAFWKGYQISPTLVEFYQAHDNNYFADRLVFTRPSGGDRWQLKRVAT